MASLETHIYSIHLEVGTLLEAAVEQKGIDVRVALFDPLGKQLLVSDRPIDDIGDEPLLALAEAAGAYRMEVTAGGGLDATGSYNLRVATDSLPTAQDRLRASAQILFARGEELAWGGDCVAALPQFEEARKSWKAAEDWYGQAEALHRLGDCFRREANWPQSRAAFKEAATHYRRAGHVREEAICFGALGSGYLRAGEIEKALEHHRRGLTLRREAGDQRGEAIALQSIAQIYQRQDEIQTALDHFDQALSLFDPVRDRRYRAYPLHNLGALYRSLGKPQRALDYLLEAEEAWQALGDERQRAFSLNQIGEVLLELHQHDQARDYFRRALEIRESLEDARDRASTLINLGRTDQAAGDFQGANAAYENASNILSTLNRPRTMAKLLARIGSLRNADQEAAEAIALYSRARKLYQEVGDRTGEAESLLGLAIAERQAQRPEAALEAVELALAIAETVRTKTFSDDLRISYFATFQHFFDFYIDLRMQLHAEDDQAGHDVRALEASERAKARSLIDLLGEVDPDPNLGSSAQLIIRERTVQRRLNSAEKDRLKLAQNPGSSPQDRTASEKTVRALLEELDAVRADIRRTKPRYAHLTQPAPLDLTRIQRQLLDADTAILEYKLGAKNSFLWLVTQDSLISTRLAPESQIEDLVRAAHGFMKRSHRRGSRIRAEAYLCELSTHLLTPVAEHLADHRLLIVADGALQYLPFAALPDPRASHCSEATPLIERHEVVHIPSASALAALREQEATKPDASRLIAVMADPVFTPLDERLAFASTHTVDATLPDTAPTVTQPRSLGRSEEYQRLRFSDYEAAAIVSRAPPGQSFSALGLEARKDLVTSGGLNDYRVLHFATHGILNTEAPELSGAVLSLVDEQGDSIDGILRAHEVYNLELGADLVVLSACETALGKEVRGEGLVGLTRGFMHAGASRFLVSLWAVDDRSTAELMERFYGNLFSEEMAPSAALREAQRAMRSSGRSAPFFWAGFVLQGDWTPLSPIE